MTRPRATARLRLNCERLEGREVPSASLGLASPYAVGTDADPTGNVHSTVTTYNPSGSFLEFPGQGHTFSPFETFAGGVRAIMADFNGDGTADLAVATGPGRPPSGSSEVRVYDVKTGTVIFDQLPFDNFTGGLFVAAADTNNNGAANLIVTPDVTGSSRTTIYGGKAMTPANLLLGQVAVIANFFAIADDNFRGGARATGGDINGDGYDDVLVSAGFGGGPRISVYDGFNIAQHAIGQATGPLVHIVPDFFLFESTLRNGAYVALGDVDGDGKADLIGGGGPGGGPRILILSGALLSSGPSGSGAALNEPIASFFDGDDSQRGGIRVAAKNLDGDGKADVLTGSGENNGSRLRAHLGSNLSGGNTTSLYNNFDVFPGFALGIFVG